MDLGSPEPCLCFNSQSPLPALHHYEVCMVCVCACVHVVSVMCIHIRKCMVYMHVSSCRNMCPSVHIWRPEVALGYLSLVLSTLVLRQCLIEPGAHAVADWLAKQPPGFSCLCLLAYGLQVTIIKLRFLCSWGSKLKDSSWQSKHLTHRATSPAPLVSFTGALGWVTESRLLRYWK